jgi:hypothetical protein
MITFAMWRCNIVRASGLAQTAHPDRVANVESSMRVGSAMDEFAFSPTLRHFIAHAPGVPMLHVPPQLVVAWHQASSSQAGSACPMAEWLRAHLARLLETHYLVLHWSDVHFCSIIVDMHVWRAGPGGGAAAAAAPSGASGSSLSTEATGGSKRKRRASSVLRVATKDTRSTVHAAVPLLHLDTFPSACRFTADKYTLLRRICTELNSLCGTAWPVHRQCDLQAHLHLCGPQQQPDDWSCGYRLLHAWKRILDRAQSSSPPLYPSTLNDVCSDVESFTSDATMVEHVRAWHGASAMVRTHLQNDTESALLFVPLVGLIDVCVCVSMCLQRAEDVAVDPHPISHPPLSRPSGSTDAIDCS